MEGSGAAGRWSDKEHAKFLEAYNLYGRNWKLVQKHIGTRNAAQARSHAQKYFAKLERAKNLKSPQTQATTSLDSPIIEPSTKQRKKKEFSVASKKSEKTCNKRKLMYNENLYTKPVKKQALDNVEVTEHHETNGNSVEENKSQGLNLALEPSAFSGTPNILNGQFGSECYAYAPCEQELDYEDLLIGHFPTLESGGVLFSRDEDWNSNDYEYQWMSQPSVFE